MPRIIPNDSNRVRSRLHRPVARTRGYERPEWSLPRGAPAGRIETIAVESAAFGEVRDVGVYLPAGHDPTAALPLVVVHDGGDFVLRHLGRTRHATEGKYGTRGDDLEYIDAAVDQQLRALAKLRGAARHTVVKTRVVRGFLEIRHEKIAAAVRNSEIGATGLDARARGAAGVDRIAKGQVGAEHVSPQIAGAGEAGLQGGGGVFARLLLRLRVGSREVHAQVRRVLGPVREMRVHVDEARQAGVAGKIHDRHMRRGLVTATGRRFHALDEAIADHDERVARRSVQGVQGAREPCGEV